VRQVGHLPELYKDARSEKYKIMEAEFSSLCRNLSFVSSTHEGNLFFSTALFLILRAVILLTAFLYKTCTLHAVQWGHKNLQF